LKAYQNQITSVGVNYKEEQERLEQAKLAVATEKHFKGISKDEFLKRSKTLVDSIRLNQSWKPSHSPKISDDYLDYDKYRRNYAKLKNFEKDEESAAEEFSLGKNVVEFVKNLDDTVGNKRLMMDQINLIREEAESKGYDPEKIEELVQVAYKAMGGQITSKDDPEDKVEINLGDFDDRKGKDHIIYGRVSPHAREEIFKLYREGWTIRDLSLRFGLLPERLKFIIWCRQYFYDEIMPNVDATTVRLALEREMMYNYYFPWVDYGLDLEDLAERENGVFFTRYRWGEIDANPPKEVSDKMEQVLKTQTRRKWDMVTEKFVGESDKGYYIKSWIVNKGHGSERVNKKFKAIIQHSQKNPQMIPDKARKKMDKGPRVASRGYGIK
jgi:hypothetical protein